jgi:hypothetical protein
MQDQDNSGAERVHGVFELYSGPETLRRSPRPLIRRPPLKMNRILIGKEITTTD